MTTEMASTFSASCCGVSVSVSLEPYPLRLRTTFGTSHSATNNRLNGLITVNVGKWTGYGECAMPPKKPGIYLADYNDCKRCVEAMGTDLIGLETKLGYQPFDEVPTQFFECARGFKEEEEELKVVRALFGVMDGLKKEKEWRVAKNGLEMALLDLWGQIRGISTAELILGLSWDIQRPTYYTVAMNDDLNEMKSSARFGLSHTPYLKLKMDKNVSFWKNWLPEFHDICMQLVKEREEGNKTKDSSVSVPLSEGLTYQSATLNGSAHPFVWSVDANADWTPEIAREMLPLLLPYKQILSMVEQPFPAHLVKEEEVKEWKAIKGLYEENGLVIFADESVSTSADVPLLSPICHGVNIKLDKTGGIREALRARQSALQLNLGVWIGIMVSSRLSTSMASCILPLSTLGGDLDGQLLVDVQSDLFTAGLRWDSSSGLCSPPSTHGLGIIKK